MGLRFRKSIKICKGVRVNLGKSGASLSIGTKGCRYSMHTSGRRTASVGIPGTGIYYTQSVGGRSKRKYNSAAYAKKQQIQQQKLALQKQKEDELKCNALLVQEYENYIEVIKSVHKECEPQIDWSGIYNAAPPYEYGAKGEKQRQAEDKYNNFKLSIIDKILGNDGEKRKQKLYDAIAIAQKEDEEAYQNWKSMHDFSENIIKGDLDSYFMAIDEANPFEDLLDYGSDFEVGTDVSDSMTIEFHVKSETVVPAISMNLTSTGKLTQKNLSKTQYYDYVQDYVCSCAIRLARELFSILPVNNVIVHAVDNIVNTSTGMQEDCTILSVKFIRDGFSGINFDRIDASDFVESFKHNMKFMKTTGFRQVERIDE